MSKDYYKVLGVEKNASAEEIKKAFRTLAHQHHPDKVGGDEAKFKEINEAYQVLGDPEKRQRYDQFGAAGFDGAQGFPGGGGFGGFNQGGVNFDFGDIGDLGDLFGSAFGFGGGGRKRSNRGRDLQVDLTLTFEESVFGASKDVSFNKTEACPRCGGIGAEPGSKMKKCGECNGAGYQVRVQRTILGAIQSKVNCSACDGAGETPEKTCSECRGSGLQKNKKTLTVDIPAGVEDGNTLRLSGQGEAIKGGQSGDLFIRLRVRDDDRFIRDGYDIHSETTINFVTATLGGTVEVETVEGKVELKIPAGTQSHTEFRLRGRGVPNRRGRGDQLVLVKVATPKNLSKKQKQMIEEFDLDEK
ncbi:MAG: molecular chaperone DnaJ [Patescibacteria group bacterium]|jgi:molecular chaperone DnaJ